MWCTIFLSCLGSYTITIHIISLVFSATKKFNFNGFCVLLLLVSVCYQKTLLTADLYSSFFTLSSGKQRIYFWFFFIFLFELQIKNSLNKYGCYTIKNYDLR